MFINRGHKKKKVYRKNSRNKEIAKIYNSSNWRNLRDYKYSLNPLCEDCLDEKIKNSDGTLGVEFTPTEEIHHILPISRGKDELKMKEIAFDIENLVSLCKFHHKQRHKELNIISFGKKIKLPKIR